MMPKELFDMEKRQATLKRLRLWASYAFVALIVWGIGDIHAIKVYTREWALAQQNLKIAEQVFSDLKDMESGQRGYILTGDLHDKKEQVNADLYLDQYKLGEAALTYHLKILEAYLGAEPLQQPAVKELIGVIGAKTNEMRLATEKFKTEGFSAAQKLVRTNRGAQQMKHIRFLMDVIRAREQANIKQSGLGL